MKKHLTLKIHFLLFIGLISICSCYAGNKQLLNDALKRGTMANGMYCIINNESKDINVDKLREYLVRNHYAVADVEYDYNKKLKSLYFFNYDDRLGYFHYKLSSSPQNIYQIKKVGLVALLRMAKIPAPGFGNPPTWEPRFNQPEKAAWTGDVIDGYIQGKGSGIMVASDYQCIYFEGEYYYGFPISITTVKYLNTKALRRTDITINPSDIETSTFDVPTGTEYHYLYRATDNWNNQITTPETKRVIAKCVAKVYEQEGHKLKETLERIRKNISIFNLKDFTKEFAYAKKFYFAYEGMFYNQNHPRDKKNNYDPENLLPIAYEIMDLKELSDWFKIDIHNLKGEVSNVRLSLLNDSNNEFISKVEKRKEEGRCGLDRFYSDVLRLLKNKSTDISEEYSRYKKSKERVKEYEEEINNRPIPSYKIEVYKSNMTKNAWSVDFNDGITGLVYYHVDSEKDYYTYSTSVLGYKTLEDAIGALYIDKKFGLTRSKGRGANYR